MNLKKFSILENLSMDNKPLFGQKNKKITIERVRS